MGIELEQFVQKHIADHYQCCVCQDVPEILPVSKLRVLCINGHIVCITCIDPRKDPSCCYLCKGQLSGNYRNQLHPAIERLLKDLEVTCSKQEAGCPWKGKCIDLHTHETTKCEHRTANCQYERSGCSYVSSPSLVATHESACVYRQVVCGRRLPWISASSTPCQSRFQAKDQASHDARCKNYGCSYWNSGCRFSGLEKDVKNHEAAYCASMHAKLAQLEKAINQDLLTSEKKRIANEVAVKTAHFKKRIDNLERDIKLAKAVSAVRDMQGENTTAVPAITGIQTLQDQKDNVKQQSLVHLAIPEVSIRHRTFSQYQYYDDLGDASEVKWETDNWTLADWNEVDRAVSETVTGRSRPDRVIAPRPMKKTRAPDNVTMNTIYLPMGQA